MAKANGTFTYPISSQADVDDADANYDNLATEFSNDVAFKDVEVNPVLKTTHVGSENDTSSVAHVASAIFTEIRKAPHEGSISNDSASRIGNRILPTTTNLTDYGTAKDTTPSFKIKVYDVEESNSNTNRKFVYSTTDDPATDTLGIDIDNYDYFILLNPEIYDSTTRQDSIRPHFAKITGITEFDTFGDGLEFAPKYPTTIPANTKFEVFKGPHKINDTDVVAVSYGLRGDASSSTPNYDEINYVSKPTFYFYNDRLEQNDQLDYMEKYTLTRLRWFRTLTNIAIDEVDTHAQYQEGSSTVLFDTTGSTETDKLCEGMSIFNSSNVFLGNIKSIDTSNDRFQLDFARIAITGTTTNFNVQIGKGIQNVVFRTEARLKGAIPNIGRDKLDAILVDNLRATDDADSGGTFNPIFWHKSFPNMKRHETDKDTATSTAYDGEMNGPSRYITSDPRPFRNDKLSPMSDITVNNPRNKMSKIAKMIGLNNSGMLPHKVKTGSKLKVINTTFSDNSKMKTLPFLASKTTGANTITFTEMLGSHDYALSDKLPTNSIIQIGSYYYVVDSFAAKSGTSQVLTTKAFKTNTATTFTVNSNVHEFQNEEVKVPFWTGVLNTDTFDSETDVIYADNKRLSVSDATIKKENTKFYGSRINFVTLSSHQNLVDYIDKNMKYVKMQDADRKFYQNSGIQRFYYYDGAFSLQEEVFSGKVESTNNETKNGLSTMMIEGRDDSASLLNKMITRNLIHTEDMLYSSLNPVVPLPSTYITLDISGVNDKVITHAANSNFVPKKYMLLFRRSATPSLNGTFIGEVSTSTSTTVTLTHKPLVDLSTTANTDIYVYDPFVDGTYLSGMKAIASNPALTTSTDFAGISDKGVVFSDSFKILRATDGTLSTSKLQGTSNVASYLADRSLGYDISKPISIDLLNDSVSTADSTFAFKPTNESGVSVENIPIPSYASETFDIVELVTKDDGGATMAIAPRCPLIMGRLENNTSDSRTDYSFYFINNNINSAGFIHRIDTMEGDTNNRDFLTDDLLWTPRETYRYWDMQKFDIGTIRKKKARAYSTVKSSITGHAVSYPIMGNGNTPATSTRSASSSPILGSNMIDSDYTLRNTSPLGLEKPPTHFVNVSGSTTDSRYADLDFLLNYHPKAQNYEIFSTGDLFPYSKLRYNNIGFSTLNFENLSCLLETSSRSSSTQIAHSSYTGATNLLDRKDLDYERVGIKSADKTTNQIKRFGIARLVEATFDWHFNPVDSDEMPVETPIEANFYQMYRAKESISNLQVSQASGSNPVITFTGGGNITIEQGQVFFDANTGKPIFSFTGSDVTISSGGSVNASNLNNITGENTVSTTDAYTIKQYHDSKFSIESFEDGFEVYNAEDSKRTDKIDFSSVYLVRPNISTTGFEYALLTSTGGDFNPPNLFLPLIFKAKASSTSNTLSVSDQSPFHPDYTWHTLTDDPYYHSSRVLAGLVQNRRNQTGLNSTDKYGIEVDVNPYENCIGVFRNIRRVSSEGPSVPSNMIQTSATLGSREEKTAYNAYSNPLNATVDFDNHTVNTMVFLNDGDAYAISGTHTRSRYNTHNGSGNWTELDNGAEYFLSELSENALTTNRITNTHNDTSSSTNGGVYKAQMMIKPVFDFDADDITISGRTITFDADETDFKHSWLMYVPDLTGYYIVAEREYETQSVTSLGQTDVSPANAIHGLLTSTPEGGNIHTIAKIINHSFGTGTSDLTANTDSSFNIVLELDRALPSTTSHTTGGPRYRLMKLAETTFRDTPNEIILNRLHCTGLDYSLTTSNFASGSNNPRTPSTPNKGQLSEGVFSAYVLMNTDVSPDSTASTTQGIIPATHIVSASNLPYSHGDVFDAFITDGTNKQRKTMTVSLLSSARSEGRRRDEYKLTYDGTITGNGVVSFGEVINVELDRKPDLGNASVCHIGTSLTIASEVETEIENIAKQAGMTTDTIQTQSTFTGNIVLSVSNNVITCKNAIQNISVGDVIYTHEGLPVGKVATNGISGSTITIENVHSDADIDLWYTPLLNDELIRRDKKTFVAANNFTQVSAFDVINTLAGKKEMDFNVKGNHIDFRKVSETSGLTKKKISYRNNRIFNIDSNSSLFAKANKVIVVGDRVEASAQIDEEGTEITFVDSTIRTQEDARVKANELLELHSRETKKLTLTMEKKGLEILEAGDVVELDFPAQSIPVGQYIIFEIENVLSSQITMTVGTFDKTIAERLSELGTGQRENTSTTFGVNSVVLSSQILLQDTLNVRVTNVRYKVTGTGETSNTGFSNVVGFFSDSGGESTLAQSDASGTEVGFNTGASLILTQYDSED